MALYERFFYLNKDIEYLVNTCIIEYDMKEAGYSIGKEFNLFTDKQLEKLESQTKKERHRTIGIYQKNKDFTKKLNQCFIEARRRFFVANELKNDEVLSIKRDAIFVFRNCYQCEFGEILFRPKNVYSSYYFLDGKEFYYDKDKLDVKGIKDELLEKHKDYMLSFLSNIFHCNENNSSDSYVRKTLRDFSDYYKHRALDIGYYRELNEFSTFRLLNEHLFDKDIGMERVSNLENVDIHYNFEHFIKPLIGILI